MIRQTLAEVRPLKPCEIKLAHEWAVLEGWNPGPCDPLVFNAADPGSLLTVEVKGNPAGVISAVRLTPEFGHLGFFVLAPDYRRSVHGYRLLEAAFERMGDRTVGGDGVLDHLRAYAHFGLLPHHLTVSYRGVAPVVPPRWHPDVGCATDTPLAELAAFDRASTGIYRTGFLGQWLALPASRALAFKRDGRVCGFGAARRCHRGVRIGPFQASDPEVAEALYDALAGLSPGEEIWVDCPETNPEAGRLMRKKGLLPGESIARLYRGTPPADLPHRIYGLMSFSLG